MHSLIHADQRTSVDHALLQLMHDGQPLDVEFQTAALGKWLRMRGGAASKGGHASGVVIDVASRAQARVNSRLAAIVNSSDDAIIGKTLEGIVTDWNRAAEAIFGYSAAEMIGKSVAILLPADKESEEHEILARIRRGEQVEHFETQRRRKDGEIIHVSMTVSPVWDNEGHLVVPPRSPEISARQGALVPRSLNARHICNPCSTQFRMP